MPEINFVLPHWLYWAGLVFFPLAAMLFFRRARSAPKTTAVSLPLAYFLLLMGGFIGVHRLYVRSALAFVFIGLFVSILLVNVEIRGARDALSGARNDLTLTEKKIARAEKKVIQLENRFTRSKSQRAQARLEEARDKLLDSKNRIPLLQEAFKQAQTTASDWDRIATTLGMIVIVLLVIDAFLLPRLVRRRNAAEALESGEGFHCPAMEVAVHELNEPFAFNRWISRINIFIGEFVAYWSVIAVFVYYYEVMSRYVFNSPTNWAHEGMFLMFGMQYLLAGGYCLREDAHVRVDVLYMHLSERGKALMNIITSVFFFLFVLTLLITGWIFFHDSWSIREVSFTEWAIQYYPIKFALPLGAALILLQGISQLSIDIHTFLKSPKRAADQHPPEHSLGT